MSSDFELLAEWSQGDRTAGNELLSRHFVSIYRFFRNKVDGEVQDLVQDTFLRCTESGDGFAGRSTFRAFLFGVARRVLYDHLRAYYRDRAQLDFAEVSVAELAAEMGTSPSQFVVRHEEHRVLLQALRTIPLDHQVALELAYWEGLSGPEIGAVLGLPANTARTRLRRARVALTERVHELLADPAVVQSTVDNLDRWAASLREYVDQDAPAS